MQKKNELKGNTLLVVHAGSAKKRFIFKRLKELGLTLVLLNKEKSPWASPYVDHWIFSDLNNHSQCLEQVRAFISNNPSVTIGGVVTFWEASVLVTSKIRDKFGFIGIPFSVAEVVKNKYLFREHSRSLNLTYPNHALIKKREDLKAVLERLRFPIVLKPIFGSASTFVVKVEEPSDLTQIYGYIKQNIAAHPDAPEWESFDILAEEYIDGDEVDIDIVLQNGKLKFYSITDNYKTNEPFFIETGQSIPSNLPRSTQQDLIRMAEETLERFGVQNGIIHFEAKVNSSGPIPIEVNLRMGGDEVYSFVKGAWGVDLLECTAKIALGIYIPPITKAERAKKFIAGTSFFSEHSGILATFHDGLTAKKKPFVEEFHFFKKIGDTVLVPPDGYEYLGWITASGENSIDASENLDWAVKQITYHVAKFDPSSSLGKTSQRNRFSSAYLTKKILARAGKIEQIRRISHKNLRRLHIGLGYVPANDLKKDERSQKGIGSFVEKLLSDLGYTITLFDITDPARLTQDVKTADINLVVLADENRHTFPLYHLTSVLDLLQIPYTGSDTHTLALCENEIQSNKILSFGNIPLPRWDYITDLAEKLDPLLDFPLRVKPVLQYGDTKTEEETIVENSSDLKKAIKKIVLGRKRFAIIQELLKGDEYEIAILGNNDQDMRALPLIRYQYSLPGKPTLPQIPPKNVNKKLLSLITEIALDTYYALGCTDYATVRVKVDANDNPYVLGCTPNPVFSSDSSFVRAAKADRMNDADLLEEIITIAVNRYEKIAKTLLAHP